ncbi:hypothetical protein PV05_01377 [Exophiala xenobiotica]|uniref:Velvet complex subunit laeA n=1 Tax=Exophiala xenobiotica TaxID=348802 RepID=A0A0D2C8E1_9EURO|nr:uncharacterized protein PV05_01377 [Exophiala xenobiotica]KIW61226.1 hypothetical protein PV05_01377 [Exophiala xenobiotica]
MAEVLAHLPGRQTVQEYGREYGTFRRGQYMLPHDRKEAERLDLMDTMIKKTRPPATRLTQVQKELLKKPASALGERVRILDLGCGTGVWMNQMADFLPDAEFVGVDIHYQGPELLPPNVGIRAPWDYEGPWALGEKSWDLIHLQLGLGSVSDWPGLYRKIRRHLIPGKGIFESVEIDFQPRCDDGTLKKGRLTDWWDLYIKGSYEAVNRRLHYDPNTGEMLKAAGFRERDIQHVVYRIPLNGYKHPGQEPESWWQVCMSSDNDGGCGLEAMSLFPLCHLHNWPTDHVRRLCNEAVAQAADPNVHAYNELHIWTARAPSED